MCVDLNLSTPMHVKYVVGNVFGSRQGTNPSNCGANSVQKMWGANLEAFVGDKHTRVSRAFREGVHVSV